MSIYQVVNLKTSLGTIFIRADHYSLGEGGYRYLTTPWGIPRSTNKGRPTKRRIPLGFSHACHTRQPLDRDAASAANSKN